MLGILVPEYLRHPPAWFYTRILVGPGAALTPRFATAHGITHVINCAQDEYCPLWFRTAYPHRYAVMNAYDSPQHNILDWYPMFEAAMQRFLREGTGVVYVHCHAGMNRSGFLALAYVVTHFSIGLPELIAATRRQRPVLFQNPVFMNQVQEFINNGRVSRPKDSGCASYIHNVRNLGLVTPGDRTEPARIEDNAGEPEGGTGDPSEGTVGPLPGE
jgi:hypothetical protein